MLTRRYSRNPVTCQANRSSTTDTSGKSSRQVKEPASNERRMDSRQVPAHFAAAGGRGRLQTGTEGYRTG